MKLTEQDAKLFFDLMWPLQYFVNRKLNIHASIGSIDEYIECTMEEKIEVRKALYAKDSLIDSFIQENPEQFSRDRLSIVSSWKNAIEGRFYIERLLKKYAVFIGEENVYGVIGLYQGFDELVHRSNLPLYVQAVLLPFKGRIVYDGVFQQYNIYFGGGVKRNIKETYMTAKQNNRIIESLVPTSRVNQRMEVSRPLKDWKTELDELAERSKKLRGGAECPAIHSPAFSLVKASIEFAQMAISDPDDLDNLYKSLRRVERALSRSSTILDREDRL